MLLKSFILSFIPIFIAIDGLGNIPLFLSLTERLTNLERKTIITKSVIVATVVAILFMFLGKLILRVMGISISDFKIAGGMLLFILSVRLLLWGKKLSFYKKDIGIFPLATPLITGPAVLTTVLMMSESFGYLPTFISLILNMGLAWFMLLRSDLALRFMGREGLRALSKILDIFLASIAVMLVREGITEVF